MIKRDTGYWSRWLHIYLSMFSFAALLFFAVTGITLNHPEWFNGLHEVKMLDGSLHKEWVSGHDTGSVRKNEIIEYLRNKYNIRARLADFRIDEYECSVSFNGPGFSADGFIDRSDGSYDLTITEAGVVGVLNDLHKGRDSGRLWALVIDISAVLMVLVSLTGFIMIFFIIKRRIKGLWLAVVGAVVFIGAYLLFV